MGTAAFLLLIFILLVGVALLFLLVVMDDQGERIKKRRNEPCQHHFSPVEGGYICIRCGERRP